MKQNDPYFRLYANCMAVKGAKRSMVYDLQKGFYINIPGEGYNLLIELKTKKVQDVFLEERYHSDYLNVFIVKLIELGLGFYCDNPDNFPEVDLNFNSPYHIEDCIIELSEITLSNYKPITESLTKLGCQTLELRGYEHVPLDGISQFLSYLINSRIRCAELYIKYSDQVPLQEYIEFIDKNPILNCVIIHSCNDLSLIQTSKAEVLFTAQEIHSASCCGQIGKELFKINLPFYLESTSANNCLNRKVSIDVNGNIKNCPALVENFGNINSERIEDVIEEKEFKKYWQINKDDIKTCKDCEFRYVCSDCRAYTEDPDDMYSKPLKCGYDPYTGVWEEWSTNPLKQKAIEYYGMKELVLKG